MFCYICVLKKIKFVDESEERFLICVINRIELSFNVFVLIMVLVFLFGLLLNDI